MTGLGLPAMDVLVLSGSWRGGRRGQWWCVGWRSTQRPPPKRPTKQDPRRHPTKIVRARARHPCMCARCAPTGSHTRKSLCPMRAWGGAPLCTPKAPPPFSPAPHTGRPKVDGNFWAPAKQQRPPAFGHGPTKKKKKKGGEGATHPPPPPPPTVLCKAHTSPVQAPATTDHTRKTGQVQYTYSTVKCSTVQYPMAVFFLV